MNWTGLLITLSAYALIALAIPLPFIAAWLTARPQERRDRWHEEKIRHAPDGEADRWIEAQRVRNRSWWRWAEIILAVLVFFAAAFWLGFVLDHWGQIGRAINSILRS